MSPVVSLHAGRKCGTRGRGDSREVWRARASGQGWGAHCGMEQAPAIAGRAYCTPRSVPQVIYSRSANAMMFCAGDRSSVVGVGTAVVGLFFVWEFCLRGKACGGVGGRGHVNCTVLSSRRYGAPLCCNASHRLTSQILACYTYHSRCIVPRKNLQDGMTSLLPPTVILASRKKSSSCASPKRIAPRPLPAQARLPRRSRQGRASWSVRSTCIAFGGGLTGEGMAAKAHRRAARVRSHAA